MTATQTQVSKSNPKTSTKGASKSNPAKKLSGEDKADALAAKAAKARAAKSPEERMGANLMKAIAAKKAKAEGRAKGDTKTAPALDADLLKLAQEQGERIALTSLLGHYHLAAEDGSVARAAVEAAFALGQAMRKRGGSRGPRGTGKSAEAAKLFLRPEGVTSRQVLDLTGWPAVSMPALAKRAGIEIYKRGAKDGAVIYFGRK
jgi:hypothetical protein